MGTTTFRLTSLPLIISLRLLLFTVFTTNLTHLISSQVLDICKVAFCGEGKCENINEFPGFDCKCNSGWTKFNISNHQQLPPCVLPNCTINFQCGLGSPSSLSLPPPPPPSFLLLPFDPCVINLCLEGKCERNGDDFKCQCFEGSANLFNNPKFPCFKKCELGADCNGIELGPPTPPTNSGSRPTGDILNGSWKLHMPMITTIVLATVFLHFF